MIKDVRIARSKDALFLKDQLAPYLEEFGGRIGWTAAEGVQLLVWAEFVGETEVGYFDVHLGVQQEVLRFEVTVDDLLLVAVLHRRDNLTKLGPRLPFSHLAVGYEKIEHLT